ncbi:MAG TPA: amidohydrolase family protein [Nocardioidaceae bacterium]|nr:amidohydrolase family protein [Nocardioidaceae bacterium]
MALVLRGGLMWDGVADQSRPADLVVDEVVTGVHDPGQARPGADDLVVELDGAFVLPGLVDAHVHLVWSGGADPVAVLQQEGEQLTVVRALTNAQQQLRAGVTTVRDLGSSFDIAVTVARAVDRGLCEGPTVIASGRTVIMTGGHDPFWGVFSDGPEACTRAVRQQVSVGAGVIKTAATGGVYGRSEGEQVGQSELTFEELAAISAEAHRLGRRVAAHALGTDGIRNAVLAGIDTVEHGVFLTEDIVEHMRVQGTVLCPTLAVYRTLADGVDGTIPAYATGKATEVTDAHRASFAMALEAGIPIIAGTDAGAPHTPHPSLVTELETLHAYGMTPVQALRAATSTAAAATDAPAGTGTIGAGAPADLLIVTDDPFAHPAALRDVWGVVRHGHPVVTTSPFALMGAYGAAMPTAAGVRWTT